MREKVLCQPSKHGNKYVFDKTNSYFWLNPAMDLEAYLATQKQLILKETNKSKRATAKIKTDMSDWIHKSQEILQSHPIVSKVIDLDEAMVAKELDQIYQELDILYEDKKRLVSNTQKSIQGSSKKISSLLGQN